MTTNQEERKGDLESGAGGDSQLYPGMMENPQLRWSFIRKVYSIVAVQLVLTVAVAAAVVFVHPIKHFLTGSFGGMAVFAVILITPFIVLCPLHAYRKKHPMNFFLLAIFTVALAFSVGVTCAFSSGKVILEAAILTSVVVVSLTLYTFWAAKRGHDFNFLGPFLFGALLILIIFTLIQIFFPRGKLSMMVYGCVASIIFCGFIVYDTDNMIKRHSYDEYILAAISLYLDILNLFVALLTLF